jgi:fucose permease
MRTNALGGALGIALFLLSGTSSFLAPLLLFFAGFSLSTLIPLTLTYAMTTFPEVSSTASGWVLFNNGLGTFLFPWLFGFVGGRFGFAVVLAAVPCALLGVFLFQQLLVRTGRRIPEEKGAVTCADRRP